jgi:hypothetical protein
MLEKLNVIVFQIIHAAASVKATRQRESLEKMA